MSDPMVRVTLGNIRTQRRYGCLLPVEDIEPTPVFVSPDGNGTHFNMMRESGYDRTHVPMYTS